MSAMEEKKNYRWFSPGIFVIIALAVVIYFACVEFYAIAWGTGSWLGEFSLKWALAFFLFVAVCISNLIFAGLFLFAPSKLAFLSRALNFLDWLAAFRWVLIALTSLILIWILQYTAWGIVFSGTAIRLLTWIWSVALIASLLASSRRHSSLTVRILLAVLITGIFFSVASSLTYVTSYPFSLGWSEGNRLWDYSLYFGRARYLYPADSPLSPYLDIGRELLGGLPFILPNITILEERLWLAFMNIVPYVILGWLAFVWAKDEMWRGILAGLWASLFLQQGPIHSPLLFCAMLVAISWKRPLWFALPAIILAGYFAQISRFTWMFAPAMWIGMLELCSASLKDSRIPKESWVRVISLTFAGLLGGVFLPGLIELFKSGTGNPAALQVIPQTTMSQSLLWYRLLPNATYGTGILLGLLIACGPLLIILFYLLNRHRWVLNVWQYLMVGGYLLLFLVVGLIVSTKIGGGGDLHNMDMFIIGLFFAGAIAWRNGGQKWIKEIADSPFWMRTVLVLMIAVPSLQPLTGLRPLSFADSLGRLMTLTNTQNPKVLGSLPAANEVQGSLAKLKMEVDAAKVNGEVLFMDQRQLLTFGYIRDVPLVPDYDKKVLMDQALSSNQAYFLPFYRDLASHRFVLIVSDPLRVPIKDSDYQFGEENNAWVKWVAIPILCYYEPMETLAEVHVQLLAPRQGDQDCSKSLPVEIAP